MLKNKLSKFALLLIVFFVVYFLVFNVLQVILTCMGQCPAWEIALWNNLRIILWSIFVIILAFMIYKTVKPRK